MVAGDTEKVSQGFLHSLSPEAVCAPVQLNRELPPCPLHCVPTARLHGHQRGCFCPYGDVYKWTGQFLVIAMIGSDIIGIGWAESRKAGVQPCVGTVHIPLTCTSNLPSLISDYLTQCWFLFSIHLCSFIFLYVSLEMASDLLAPLKSKPVTTCGLHWSSSCLCA